MTALQKYHWPGNIRELENLIKRYVILGNEEVISSDLVAHQQELPTPEINFEGPIALKTITRQATRELERKVILKVLQAHHWTRTSRPQTRAEHPATGLCCTRFATPGCLIVIHPLSSSRRRRPDALPEAGVLPRRTEVTRGIDIGANVVRRLSRSSDRSGLQTDTCKKQTANQVKKGGGRKCPPHTHRLHSPVIRAATGLIAFLISALDNFSDRARAARAGSSASEAKRTLPVAIPNSSTMWARKGSTRIASRSRSSSRMTRSCTLSA